MCNSHGGNVIILNFWSQFDPQPLHIFGSIIEIEQSIGKTNELPS